MVSLVSVVQSRVCIWVLSCIFIVMTFSESSYAEAVKKKLPVSSSEKPSLFDLSSSWKDQNGKAFTWSTVSGQTSLVAMIYTSCPMSCPLITQELLDLLRKLPASEQKKVRVLLFSFDPSRDSPEKLKEYAVKRKLDPHQWTLLTGTEDGARELAVVLGVQLKKLQDGEFSHSNTITILDSHGRIAHQQADLGNGKGETLAAIQKSLKTPHSTAQ